MAATIYKMSKEELEEFLLTNGIPMELANAMKDEEIDGMAFMSLTEDDLKTDFAIKVGHRKKLISIINAATIATDASSARPREPHTPPASLPGSLNESKVDDEPNDTPNKWSCKQRDSLDFSVASVMKNHRDGKELHHRIQRDNVISEAERCLLVRIMVAKLIDSAGNYPSKELKVSLADAIITTYPCLAVKMSGGGMGSKHYYDPATNTGFIAYRFKTLRKKLTPSKKKHAVHKKRSGGEKGGLESDAASEFDEQNIKEKITLMQFINPVESARQNVIDNMEATFKVRRDEISKKSPSITELVTKYPRLIDFDGDIIIHEFKMLESAKAANFLSKFTGNYDLRILKYCELYKVQSFMKTRHIVDDGLRAILLLATLLPPCNTNRKKMKTTHGTENQDKGDAIPNENLMQFLEPGSDIEHFKTTRKESQKQPFLVCVGTEEEGGHFFLVVDRYSIAMGKCPITAFDKLFKSFFVFNVNYPESLNRFYNFVETRIFSLKKSASLAASEGLDASLQNIKID